MILENATIITMDGERRIVRDGAIAVKGSKIVGVGKKAEVRAAFPDDRERIDLRGMVVVPGLVDTHIHLTQALLRGCADDLGLIDFLVERVWVLLGNCTAADSRLSTELCVLEMLKSGTTAFVESMLVGHYGFDGVAQVVEQAGIRAALSKTVMDLPSYVAGHPMHPGMVEDGPTSVRQALAAHARWQGAGDGRIQVWFGPRPPGGCTPSLYREVAAAAQARNMGVTMHLAEVREDVAYIRREHGLCPMEYMESVGLVGPRVLLIHTVWLDEQDISIVARTGTHITHNPVSNAKLASGIAPVAAMLAAGVNVCLGTDAATCNNTHDLIQDMRWASCLQKVKGLDPLLVPAETVLEMATRNGARAMGLEQDIGSIEVVKRADLVAIDMDKPHLVPAPDQVSAIVFAARGSDVDTVMVDGRLVVQGGRALTLDEERILHEARQRAGQLYRRAGVAPGPRWPVV